MTPKSMSWTSVLAFCMWIKKDRKMCEKEVNQVMVLGTIWRHKSEMSVYMAFYNHYFHNTNLAKRAILLLNAGAPLFVAEEFFCVDSMGWEGYLPFLKSAIALEKPEVAIIYECLELVPSRIFRVIIRNHFFACRKAGTHQDLVSLCIVSN